MSVAQKDGIRTAGQISYEDLYRRWEQSNWEAYSIDFSADRAGWDALSEIQRKSALWIYSMFFYGEDSVTDNLAPYIDAAPPRGAEVLPRDPAGRRGAPRGLLPPLLQGGDRRRRHGRRDASAHPAAARLGLSQRLRPARRDGRLASQGPIAAELRPRDCALPHGRRGHPGPAGPALHRGLLHQVGLDARVQRGDGEHLARRAAPHRLRRQGALRALRAVGGVQGGGRRAAARDHAVLARRVHAAQLGPRVHPLLRVRDRGHLRLRDALGAHQVAGDRLPARGDARRLPDRPRDGARGGRPAPDHPDEGRGDGRAQRSAGVLAGDPASCSSTSSRGSRGPTPSTASR